MVDRFKKYVLDNQLFHLIVAHSQGEDIYAENGWAIRISALNGYLEMVKYLVLHGADIQYSGALRYAAENGHLDIVVYLVSNGADVGAEDNLALQVASMNGHLDIVIYLVSHGADIQNSGALQSATEQGHLDVVKFLIEPHKYGVNIQGTNAHINDDYILIWTAAAGQLEIVKYLVLHGADACTQDKHALREAWKNKHWETVDYLQSLCRST